MAQGRGRRLPNAPVIGNKGESQIQAGPILSSPPGFSRETEPPGYMCRKRFMMKVQVLRTRTGADVSPGPRAGKTDVPAPRLSGGGKEGVLSSSVQASD